MMKIEWIQALLGGVLVGISASLMLLWKGRVAGISGIAYGLLGSVKGDLAWRLSFLFGLVTGGALLYLFKPDVFGGSPADGGTLVIAGLLVGFGTALGSGCTSGHGVCGISRLSPRSIVATLLFVLSGVLTVSLLRGMI